MFSPFKKTLFDFKKDQLNLREISKLEIKPYLEQIKKIKKRRPAQEEGVVVKHINGEQSLISDYSIKESTKGLLSNKELSDLNLYITKEFRENKIIDFKSKFKFINQFKNKKTLVVRFQQIIQKGFKGKKFEIPIEGAQVLLSIKNSKVATVSTSAFKFDLTYAINFKTGLDFNFSENEFNRFMYSIKFSPEARAQLEKRFKKYLEQPLKFEKFLNRKVFEQREIFNSAFNKMGRLDLIEFFYNLALKNKLSLKKSNNIWRFHAKDFLGLSIEYDIVFREAVDSNLEIKNLSYNFHKAVRVQSFESPLYPGGKKDEGGKNSLNAKTQLERAVAYYSEKFNWVGYRGKNPNEPVVVHTNLQSLDFKENAAWVGSVEQILVGEDGETLSGIDNSLGILSHEFSHAVVEFSSGLKYRGQSGAINEHFSDIMGALVEASYSDDNSFLFTIGEELLNEDIKAEKRSLLGLIFKKLDYSEEQKESYRLESIGMRHLYAPELSYSTQYSNMSDVKDLYFNNCEPSYDNDNCGVHVTSGVLNKALSLVIAIEGMDKIAPLIFNTVVFRLIDNSSFKDYLIEITNECQELYNEDSVCEIILASFARVGVLHPEFPIQGTDKPKGISNEIPISGNSTSPMISLCGWVQEYDKDNFRIFDNKFNGLLVNRNFSFKTEGDYKILRKSDCACVTGYLSQKKDFKDKLQNIFLRVIKVSDRGNKCEEDLDINKIKPDRKLSFQVGEENHFKKALNYCGWVSVNSRSKNITIIDNKFDAAVLTSGYKNLSYGDYSNSYNYECGCINGVLSETINSKGTIFNFFKEVRSVKKRPTDACIGLEWK